MSAVDELAKMLGNAIGKNDEVQEVSHWLNTSYPPLNEILSGMWDGGIPFGRIVEIYGPSSSGKTALATMIMIEAQRLGGVAMFLDHENTFDVGMAEQMGLRTEFPFWIYKRPDTWEESNTLAMKAAEAIRKSGAIAASAPIVCVFDSVASMIPKSVFEKGIDEYTMNDTTALARVTSTTLKTVNNFTSKQNATMIYLNQIRTKPGVVYGDPTCLRGDVVVPLVDGTDKTIKEIVDGKLPVKVWSYNEATDSIEHRKVIDWHDNGPLPKGEDWIFIQTDAVQTRNGAIGLTVTGDHKILTTDGWKEAKKLTLSDKLISKVTNSIGGTFEEFLHGVMAGDCSISSAYGGNRKTAHLSIQDSNDPEYAKWKVEKLSRNLSFKKTDIKWGESGQGVRYDSEYLYELFELMKHKRDPYFSLNELTGMKLALWIMDDGYLGENDRYTVSVKRKKNTEYLEELADMLFDKHGLRSRVHAREGALIFDKESSTKIAELIAKFVPPCMERKLPENQRGKYEDFSLWTETNVNTVTVNIKDIRKGSSHRGYGRYDVTVEGNHNYLVGNKKNGVIVHNCTPGGSAMEFYASIRLALGRTKMMEEEGGKKEMVGQIITVKTTKNKVARPFKETQLHLMFRDDGSMHFDFVSSSIDKLIELGKLRYAKPRVTWTDGKQYFRKGLAEHIKENGLEKELYALFN